jgi:hypothetical protein
LALHADGPAADRAGNMGLYGWLVGSWDLDVTEIQDDGSTLRRPGEWHVGWVLEGRAIQDVWIVPPRGTREHTDAAAHRNYYGTTLRVYDPRIDAWRIQWTDPVVQAVDRNFKRYFATSGKAISIARFFPIPGSTFLLVY